MLGHAFGIKIYLKEEIVHILIYSHKFAEIKLELKKLLINVTANITGLN